MARKTSLNHILALTLAVTVLLLSIAPVWPVRAAGGVVLRPPFNGTYRVTAYFDHNRPTYCIGANGVITIYNGEQVAANCATQTGEPYPYDGHDGWDWSMGTGTDVLAAAAGTVVFSTDNWVEHPCYGRTIIIDHGNGYYTQYSHLSQRLVNVGNPVTAGQHIAESGNTSDPNDPNHCPVAAHLHFGVRHGGWANTTYAIDPFGWRGSGRDPLFNYNGKESSCLWAGVPGDDISCADIIVEDDGAGWSEYGWWATSTNGNGYREHHTYSWPYASSYAHWAPTLPAKGYYQIYAFVPPISSRTTHADYLVSGISQETVYRDQSGPAPRWMSLGTFEFPIEYGWVRLDDYTTEQQYSHWVAADGMKFSAGIVHLPDVRNSGGWASSIVVRSNSSSSAKASINYYNASGGLVSYQTTTIASNGSVTRTPPSGFSGSAVVVASQDVAVVVENGSSIANTSYTGKQNADTEAYLPTLVVRSDRQAYVYLQNASPSTANVILDFYNRDGTLVHSQSNAIPANGKLDLHLNSIPAVFDGFAWTSGTGSLHACTTNGTHIVVVRGHAG